MTTLDELLATIRRLPLDERMRLIEQAKREAAEDTPEPPDAGGNSAMSPAASTRKLSVDELLAARLIPPPGVGPVTLDDMERAIAEGATSRGSI